MKKEMWLTLALIGGALAIASASPGKNENIPGGSGSADVDFRNQSGLPRGQRNNNPGNIKYNAANNWQGKVPFSQNTDGTFEQFISYKYGIRAMLVLLRNYINGGQDTLQKIIFKYAPPSVDPSQSYLNFVVNQTGIQPNASLSFSFSNMKKILPAMCRFENGKAVVSEGQVGAVWAEFFA